MTLINLLRILILKVKLLFLGDKEKERIDLIKQQDMKDKRKHVNRYRTK